MNFEDYVISLTSVPHRLNDTLPRVLDSIKDLGFRVIVNIPKSYRKEWQINDDMIPGKISNVIMHRCSEDWGPATKLLGTIEWARKNNANLEAIITVDDDIIFKNPKEAIVSLIEESKSKPGCVITRHAIKTLHSPYMFGNGLQHRVSNDWSDGVAGYLGVLYPFKTFNNDEIFTSLSIFPNGFYSEDDAYLGGMASRLKCPVWSSGFVSDYTPLVTESAVAYSLTPGCHRVEKESELYTFLVNIGYLPNNNRPNNIKSTP